MSAFGLTMATLSLLLCVSFVAVRVGVVPESLLGQGKHAAQNVAMLTDRKKKFLMLILCSVLKQAMLFL